MNILSVQLKEFDAKNVSGSEELSRLDAIKTTLEGKDTPSLAYCQGDAA